ncbi:MAG: hypothetical protein NT074_00955 [Methanomicrobiales archaeon]|nr:hypothetical protein [Methanomicrobiales archaeon]
MLAQALNEALHTLRSRPSIWLTGFIPSVLIPSALFLQYSFGSFVTSKAEIIAILILPFVFGGALEVTRAERGGIYDFARGGVSHYFRILLPSLLIGCAALLTIGAVVGTVTLLGISPGSGILGGAILGVALPFLLATFFYDTAAVYEKCRVLESIRRSVELVMLYPTRVFFFYALVILVSLAISVVMMVIWAGLLAERLTPLLSMQPEEIQVMTPTAFVDLIGHDGIILTAVLAAVATTLILPFVYAFKASFYKQISMVNPAPEPVAGEFDNKGRWYKY